MKEIVLSTFERTHLGEVEFVRAEDKDVLHSATAGPVLFSLRIEPGGRQA